MVDLETCSTTPRAALLQAGWAVFDPAGEGVAHAQEFNVNIDSCMRLGGEVSDGTVRFWLDQPQEARASVAKAGVPVRYALEQLVFEYNKTGCESIWSNGATFDIVIIEHYMRALSIDPPWRFYQHRDTRTLWAVAEAKGGWRREKGVVAHTAMADCVAQVAAVQGAWRHLMKSTIVHRRPVD